MNLGPLSSVEEIRFVRNEDGRTFHAYITTKAYEYDVAPDGWKECTPYIVHMEIPVCSVNTDIKAYVNDSGTYSKMTCIPDDSSVSVSEEYTSIYAQTKSGFEKIDEFLSSIQVEDSEFTVNNIV